MSESMSDYRPGSAPVPVGTIVEYFGSHTHGRYRIIGHSEPNMRNTGADPEEFFPDGVAYVLWLSHVPVKMDNGHASVSNVRRLSFRVADPEGEDHE